MAETSRIERLNASDMFVLLWDDFGWSADIGALAILDGAGLQDRDGQVPIEVVRRRIEASLHLVPRFRQRLYRPPWGLGRPLWVDASSFDLADHVRVLPLPAPGGEAQLLAASEQLCQRRLDPARPLWQLWLLTGLSEGRLGMLLKLHHAIADGVAGVAAFGALLDLAPEAAVPVAPPWTPAPLPTAGELLRDNVSRRVQGLDRAVSALGHPSQVLGRARRAGPAWREFLAEQRAPRTSLNGPIGSGRRLAVVRSRLDLTKRIAQAHDAKVNDVVLAAVAGGLRALLQHRREPVEELVLRAMVPISLHLEQPGQASGNQDTWMVVPLPIGEPDHARRLRLITAQTAERKNTARPQVGSGISGTTLAQHAFLHLLAHQRLMNTSITNVPGPPVPLYLAGARLLELFPVVSLAGNFTLVVAVLSYAGQLNLTAVADAPSCADVEVFAQGVRNALDELARSVAVPST